MAELNEKAFQQIGRAVKTGGAASDSIFGRMIKRLTPAGSAESLDWADDADWARLQQEPLRARALLRLAVLFLLLLVLWAAYAELDEVTRGDGKVVPTSQVQVIQSVDGGIVEELPVREGQLVEAGQLLLRVDSTRFLSTMLESRASLLALQAKALRLHALTQGGSFIPPPELLRDAPDIVAQEMRLYRSRREEISAQVSISQNQLLQRQQELNEVRARKEQAERGLELMLKELNATKPMVATGAVSEVEVLRLDREVARLRGDREQADAQISRVQAAIQEASRRIE